MKKRKIPTLLALFFLVAGLVVVVLVDTKQILRPRASFNTNPENIMFSNITDSSIVVSWTTRERTNGHVRWGNKNSIVYLFNRENSKFTSAFTHYVQIDNLKPNTEYYLAIYSNRVGYLDKNYPWKIKTGIKLPGRTPNPIYGQIDNNKLQNKSLIVYLTTKNGSLLSTTTDDAGKWIVDISKLKSFDLQSYVDIKNNTILEIIAVGENKLTYAITYPGRTKPLQIITLGKAYDLRKIQPAINTQVPEAVIKID